MLFIFASDGTRCCEQGNVWRPGTSGRGRGAAMANTAQRPVFMDSMNNVL